MRILTASIFLLVHLIANGQDLPESVRSRTVISKQAPLLQSELATKGMQLGSPIFIRIFKEEMHLEVWVQRDTIFELFKTFEICYYSGGLGTKTKQGDGKSPEGFYYINKNRLNPWSNFHLSLNLGYPNTYERTHGYTGNYLMVHGSCVSIGCYAMTDASIEEIYTLGYKALEGGQPFFRVHSFPFKMTSENMERHQSNTSIGFWKNLKQGYDWFETHKLPPNVTVRDKRYVFGN